MMRLVALIAHNAELKIVDRAKSGIRSAANILIGSDIMLVSLIVAVAENDVIGAGWENAVASLVGSERPFDALTMGKPIIMGRKTFASLGKALDGRDNIVVTRDSLFEAEGVSAVNSVNDALVLARVLARTSGADESCRYGRG